MAESAGFEVQRHGHADDRDASAVVSDPRDLRGDQWDSVGGGWSHRARIACRGVREGLIWGGVIVRVVLQVLVDPHYRTIQSERSCCFSKAVHKKIICATLKQVFRSK